MKYRYIVIEGNIGAGKTSLARRMADDLSARLVLEEFADNPFLPKFYNQPERYAFPLELSFLAERFSQLSREIAMPELFAQPIISDYFINKCQIFARNNLVNDEYELFLKLFSLVETQVPRPDLLIFLYQDIEKLQQNIRKRGRAYEQKITNEYLQNIQDKYLDFIRLHEDLRVIIADTNALDFVENNAHYALVKGLLDRDVPPGITRVTF